jgi:hypothetical protein
MKKIISVLMMGFISFALCGCSAPKTETFILSVNEIDDVYAVNEEIDMMASITNESLWTYEIGSGVSLIKVYTDEDNPVEFLLLYSDIFREHEKKTFQKTVSFSTAGEHTIIVRCWFLIDDTTYCYVKEIPVIIQSAQES